MARERGKIFAVAPVSYWSVGAQWNDTMSPIEPLIVFIHSWAWSDHQTIIGGTWLRLSHLCQKPVTIPSYIETISYFVVILTVPESVCRYYRYLPSRRQQDIYPLYICHIQAYITCFQFSYTYCDETNKITTVNWLRLLIIIILLWLWLLLLLLLYVC